MTTAEFPLTAPQRVLHFTTLVGFLLIPMIALGQVVDALQRVL